MGAEPGGWLVCEAPSERRARNRVESKRPPSAVVEDDCLWIREIATA